MSKNKNNNRIEKKRKIEDEIKKFINILNLLIKIILEIKNK